VTVTSTVAVATGDALSVAVQRNVADLDSATPIVVAVNAVAAADALTAEIEPPDSFVQA
jgi:hypothetical protein